MAISGPQIVKINKKTGSGDYTLYHPQTDTSVILHLGDTTDPDFSGLTRYNAQGDQSSTGGYYHVKDVLDVIFTKLGTIANVLEFKGVVALWSDLPTATATTVGDVYGVNEVHDDYPAGTLYVGCDNGASATTRYTWTPLGGKGSSVYALKTEAIKYLSLSNSGEILYGYASESQATHSLGSVALQNQALGNLGIDSNGLHGFHVDGSSFGMAGLVTDTVASGSYALVSADAVYNFAATASKINVSTTDGTVSYYITMVSGTTGSQTLFVDSPTTPLTYNPNTNTINADISGTAAVAQQVEALSPVNAGYLLGESSLSNASHTTSIIQSGIKWDTTAAGAGAASKYLNVNITGNASTATSADTANTATTADKVGHTLTIGGLTYSGAADLNVQLSSGLQMVNPTAGVHLLAVKTLTNGGLGFDSSNNMFVQLASAGGLFSSGSGIALSDTGIGTGTYSALQVDAKGRAVAGGQAVVFAENASDPDLQSLVVGGLAFIGTAATYTDSANTTHSIPTGTDPKIG